MRIYSGCDEETNVLICLTLSESTIEAAVEKVRSQRQYIDMAELRLDFLSKEECAKAHLFPSMVDVPCIATNRRRQDGGMCDLLEKARRAQLLAAMDGDFSYVDIEEDLKRGELDEKAERRGIRIIRSLHDFEKVPDDIFSRIQQLKRRGDVAKVAVTPRSVADLMTLFNAQHELEGTDKIIIGMGPYGVPTRILYKRMGSMLTFCSDNETAPGQLSGRELRLLYRADRVDDRTAIYGIIGNNVMNSLSPRIHNPGFVGIKYNAIYVPFLVDSVRSFFSLAEALHMRGFSVTVPFKVDCLSYVGNITREVKQIGACNTVVRTPGMWKAINTDYYGFLVPIERDIEEGRIRSALVIGAGGASNAIVWALRNRGVRVTILNRTLSRAEKIAQVNICQYDRLDNYKAYEGQVDLIVQTTTVGYDSWVNPIEGFSFTGREICYDIITKPKMTKFLSDAQAAGCTLHFGQEMLIAQGRLQFEAFTGYHYPRSVEIDLS